MNSASAKRIDIISDTHGYLSPALLDELKGADLIIHAGDLTSEMDYEHLRTIAPVRAVLGNNDYYRDYGPDVDRLALFTYEGLKFAVAHYREDLPVGSVDVAINGHTHATKEACGSPPGPQPRQRQLSKRHSRPHHGQNARQGRQDSEHQIY